MHRRKLIVVILLLLSISTLLGACSQGTTGSSGFDSTIAILPATATTAATTEVMETVLPASTATVGLDPSAPIIVEQPTKAVTTIPDVSQFSNATPVAQMNFSKPGPGPKVA